MANRKNRIVFRRSDGNWINKRCDASKASGLFTNQQDAINSARNMLRNSGGGELIVKGTNGRIRSKDTIAPGNDPNPPKDLEH